LQVVEITKGSKVKYELDKKTGLIKVQNYLLKFKLIQEREKNTIVFLMPLKI